jgi:hypothetical protein
LDGRKKRDMKEGRKEGGKSKYEDRIGYNNSCDNNNISRRSEACPESVSRR